MTNVCLPNAGFIMYMVSEGICMYMVIVSNRRADRFMKQTTIL